MMNLLALWAGNADSTASIDTYEAIIGASIIILLSYSFDILAKKANIPSVIMLIALGMGLAFGLKQFGINPGDKVIGALEILGTIGLILIVLEAALDLKLEKEKTSIIIRSFIVAFLVLALTVAFIGFAFIAFLGLDWLPAIIYAVPLSIMSSAIVIPSVGGLSEEKKEFMIYEATFSDILGIILFFFLTQIDPQSTDIGQAAMGQIGSIVITIIISTVISYALVYFISRVTKKANFFTIFAMLSLFYAGGKLLHLSSLIMILIFGLVLYNHKVFFRGWMARFCDDSTITRILEDFKLLTHQSAFLVRTFFFVVFGMIISLSALKDVNVIVISLVVLAIIYIVRFVHLWLVQDSRASIMPELLIAPRGLITVLLFFAIPQQHKTEAFNEGIMFVVIIVSSLVMMFALIFAKKDYHVIEDITTISDDEILGYGRDGE
ncbi:MAG: cation:proton antiporter [Saprospiraceae bacterium]|nr:cation:proton antiporter [Saprospiraceae bacterium]